MPDYLYIGIDFGTTFSGAAWALSRQPDRIKIVTKWKSDHAYNTDDAKTPTEIVYEEPKVIYEDDADGKRARTITGWGHDIRPEERPLKWFKLCLVDAANLPTHVRDSAQLRQATDKLNSLGISAVEATADYLRKLWTHTIAAIERELGKRAVDGLPFRVIVTVPAMWPPKAMERTERAARKAGILESRLCGETKLDLVPEPEAAALATLAEFRGRPGVQRGDVVTVCDCGGGTIDITSYQIEKPEPVVLVKECIGGDGDMCGGIFVDENFEKLLQRKLDKRWEKLRPEQQKKVFNTEWEYGIKRSFENDNREWEVRLPAEAIGHSLGTFRRKASKRVDLSGHDVKLSKGSLKLTREHVLEVFDPITTKIQKLIRKQVQEVMASVGRSPTCVLLVGGFGRCLYLYHALKTDIGSQGIEILQADGDGPWTAICRGAVIKALSDDCFKSEVRVTTRVSKYNYGISHMSPFDPEVHRLEDKEWIPRWTSFKAMNQMKWYLRKGGNISAQEPVKMSFTKLYATASEIPNNEFQVDIWTSDDVNPPNRKTKGSKEHSTVTVTLETPFEDLPTYTNANFDTYRMVEWEIELTCSGTLLRFAAIVNGKRQKAKNIKAEYRASAGYDDPDLSSLLPRLRNVELE
ncbi:hypothetical protein K491DRAFT_637347 [Lophiostoma macrostomum CBS 122681]|uniref:Actin-like ATPase domain-containing protein n=1 Tax=Lophiostoma macrostomum CBS 122681 TaxID=1314788 RepID=A0A6A6SWT6_9PLEO|nr:hypothetical protein K491DRAFT_637347 [Lophiostoma macrostomum CBS 122681]